MHTPFKNVSAFVDVLQFVLFLFTALLCIVRNEDVNQHNMKHFLFSSHHGKKNDSSWMLKHISK